MGYLIALLIGVMMACLGILLADAASPKPQSDFWKNYGTYGGLCKPSVVACLPRGWKEPKK